MKDPRRKTVDEKPSIAEAVRIIVSNDLPLLECLSRGIINYTWAAETIAEDVKKLTGKEKINMDAVKAALIRFQQELKEEYKTLETTVASVIARSTVELQNDIVVITVKREALENSLKEILSIASEARFFNLTQGKRTFTIVVSAEDQQKILERISEESIVDKVGDQSVILLISPYDIMYTPGVISYISRTMYVNRINVTQIISCYTDTLLILSRKDSLRALEVIQKSIEDSRALTGLGVAR